MQQCDKNYVKVGNEKVGKKKKIFQLLENIASMKFSMKTESD